MRVALSFVAVDEASRGDEHPDEVEKDDDETVEEGVGPRSAITTLISILMPCSNSAFVICGIREWWLLFPANAAVAIILTDLGARYKQGKLKRDVRYFDP
jgi:hypothetical protein